MLHLRVRSVCWRTSFLPKDCGSSGYWRRSRPCRYGRHSHLTTVGRKSTNSRAFGRIILVRSTRPDSWTRSITKTPREKTSPAKSRMCYCTWSCILHIIAGKLPRICVRQDLLHLIPTSYMQSGKASFNGRALGRKVFAWTSWRGIFEVTLASLNGIHEKALCVSFVSFFDRSLTS
jgi:hypothetical protein